MAQKKKKQITSMPVVNPHAAGIDVGARTHYGAVGQRAEEVTKLRRCYTADLHQVAEWLRQHQITTVALESTGSYP